MRVLFATGSAASYMLPPRLGDEQVNCGPDWADETAPDGQVRSLATPVGEYDLFALAARLPRGQQPDAVVCLVDASWRNLPRNLAAFKCPRVLLVADTHHLNSPLLNMLRYATAEPFDRIVLLYDRHHAGFFAAAGLRNLYWFPGLTFPHGDAAVRAVRQARRRKEIMFVGQAGRFHPRRRRLLAALAARGLPVGLKAVPQAAGLGLYGASLLGFNASLNGDLNLRMFEILAAGATLLTDRLAPASGLTDLWADGRELLTYGSADELAEVAAHALAHPRETAALGAAGAAWFDHHCNAERRRTAFQALALDGTALPKFALPAIDPTRVLFGGDADRLIDALVVYEGVQELHREAETVQVTHAAGVPADISSMWATLPRIQVNPEAGAAEADVGVFDRTTEQVPAARSLWCWNADAADGMRLAAAFAPHGFSQLHGPLALFSRTAAAPAPITATDDRRPHVLVYTDDPDDGGVAHYNHSLMAGLVAAGFRVTCAQTECAGPLVLQQRALGIRHHWIPYDTKKEFARTLDDVASAGRILDETQPDLVVFSDCCPVSNFAAREVARQAGVPYVVVVGFVGEYLAGRFRGHLGRLALHYAEARAVVAVSQENLDLLHRHFGLPAGAGTVIHYGRPELFFAPRNEAVRARLRAELHLPKTAVVAFTAARLARVKGYLYQVAALRQLAAKPGGGGLHLVWAGDGEQRPELEHAIAEAGLAGRIHLLGRRWDVADWLDAADIFVLPSEREGMPLAIMEAMAKGLPVAATAVSGIPEQLGGTGHLLPAPVPDATELVRQLTAILQAWSGDAALRRQVGAAGRRRAQQMFREATMIGHTVALIRRHLTVTAPACAEPMFREEQKVVRTRDQITPVMDPKAAMPAKCELQTVS
jgi:glycosyltransferase involved in cell wall biosynthesis